MGCILKSSAMYVFDYFGSIFENTNFDTGSWLQFSLSFYAIHNPLEFLKPEWWNSNKVFHLLLCGVWDCISDCLGGRRQPPLQFLVPSGCRRTGNSLEFSFDNPSRFVWSVGRFCTCQWGRNSLLTTNFLQSTNRWMWGRNNAQSFVARVVGVLHQ